MNVFGNFLKELRGKRSLREVSKAMDISHSYLDTLEKGYDPRTKKARKPSYDVLKKLSVFYNVSYLKLLYKAGYIDEKTFLNNPPFGEKLSEVRNEKNLTLKELQEKTSLSKSYLSKLENREEKVPDLETISKIADGLGIDPAILLREAWDFQQDYKFSSHKTEGNDPATNSYIVHKLDKILKGNIPESQFVVEYKNHQLTDKEKEDIRKFIENFIVDKPRKGNE